MDQNHGEHARRTGLIKAVGGTPTLVAAVYLVEYLVLAAVAAGVGLLLGRLAGPLLDKPSAGMVGVAGASTITGVTIGVVLAAALLVVGLATLVPVNRAARTSTVSALNNAARGPRRHARLIAFSARLPVPLLLGVRLASRRPRRLILNALSVAVTVAGIVTVLATHAHLAAVDSGGHGFSVLPDPRAIQVDQVMLIVTIMMSALAIVNAVFISWATVIDGRRAGAVVRALGASPGQVALGLATAQLLPAIPGALIGVPAGLGLYAGLRSGAGASGFVYPPSTWLLATLLGAIVVLAALTMIPALIGARRPVVEVFQAEHA